MSAETATSPPPRTRTSLIPPSQARLTDLPIAKA